MSIYTLFGVLLVCAFSLILIKENGLGQYALIFSCIAVVGASLVSLTSLGQAIGKFNNYLSNTGLSSYAELVIKAFGIAFVSEIASDTLEELGSEKLGKWLELAGRAEILLLSLPLVIELLDLAVKMI